MECQLLYRFHKTSRAEFTFHEKDSSRHFVDAFESGFAFISLCISVSVRKGF